MAEILKGELQDYQGNTLYPHSKADVVFCEDGTTAQAKLTKYENALGSVTGKTDSLEVDNANILATSKAVSNLKKNVENSLGGLTFGKDGDGNYGYYGADGSLIPFKSTEIVAGTFSTTSSSVTKVTLGFKPKLLIVGNESNYNHVKVYNEEYSTTQFLQASTTGNMSYSNFTSASSASGSIASIDDDGFTISLVSSGSHTAKRYIAVG